MLSSIAASPSASSSARDDRDVVLLRVAPDVGDHRRAERPQLRQLLRDGTPRRRRSAGRSRSASRPASRRCAAAGCPACGFSESPLVQRPPSWDEIHEVRELESVAEGARRRQDRIARARAGRGGRRGSRRSPFARSSSRAAGWVPSVQDTRNGFSTRRDHAPEADAEAAAHLGLGRELGRRGAAPTSPGRAPGTSASARRRRRARTPSARACLRKSSVTNPFSPSGAVVGREMRPAVDEAVEPPAEGEVLVAAAAEEEVARDARPRERAVEDREGRRADPAGDDGDPGAARRGRRARTRFRAARGVRRRVPSGISSRAPRAGADRLDEELHLARLGPGVRDRVGAPQVRAGRGPGSRASRTGPAAPRARDRGRGRSRRKRPAA